MNETRGTIAEFADPDEALAWRPIDDVVMGGVSSSALSASGPSRALFSGRVSLERGGGFASVRSAPVRRDLSSFEGLALRVRGDGRRYKLSLKTDRGFDGILYQSAFTAGEAWSEVRLPFDSFAPTFRGRVLTDAPPLDRGSIWTLGLMISERQAGPFELEIDWIRAFDAAKHDERQLEEPSPGPRMAQAKRP